MFKHYKGSKVREKPKYGSFNILLNASGDRESQTYGYGHSFFILEQEVRHRTSLTDKDSYDSSATLGTMGYSAHVLLKAINRLDYKTQDAFIKHLCEVALQGDYPGKAQGEQAGLFNYMEI